MFVSVSASRKGGGGKTTLASHLSVEASRAGYGPVAVIDLDPMGGLSGWWDARKADTLPSLGSRILWPILWQRCRLAVTGPFSLIPRPVSALRSRSGSDI